MRPGPRRSERIASRARRALVAAWTLGGGAAALLSSERAADADGPSVDVTETTVVAQHFAPRGNESLDDSGWGEWVNRLDALIRGGRWTAGLRLDSAVYWLRPSDYDPDSARYHDAVYPAKLFVTYSTPGLEITAGDSYVQFGRGLTLSMRKIDELGIDTTVRGLKVEMQRDPFAITAVAGFANPSHIDESSGRSLFPTIATAQEPSAPIFGSDRVVGAEVQAGRGLPVTLGTRVVRFSRCAPYRYDANGDIRTSFFDDPSGVALGSCAPDDTSTWLQSLPPAPETIQANDVTMLGQSIEVPNLGGHGKLYLEGATQYRHTDADPSSDTSGNALYAALSLDGGPLTTTLEIKSNRNFYPVAAAVDLTHAPEFNVVTYSFVPPAETPTILDTEFGYFNACVNGGRLRADVRAADSLLVYGQGIFADTKSEQSNGQCDSQGHLITSGLPADTLEDLVWDGLTGLEWTSDDALSHVFASAGVRQDNLANGDFFYRERHVEYSIVKYLGGAYSVEVQGIHRLRMEEGQNRDPADEAVFRWWHEGENYVAFKVAPAWVFSQGFEYTTQTGYPGYYFNGSVFYKFASGSNVRLFVGQQRAAFRCASGVCRFFPAFEGARAEVTLRF
jgi:hypothetical protein